MTKILEELAAGRIDAAEAARRIDALKGDSAQTSTSQPATPQPATSQPTSSQPSASGTLPESTNEELAADAPQSDAGDSAAEATAEPEDAWASATDRPQKATYTTESFAPPTTAAESAATSESEPVTGSATNAGSGAAGSSSTGSSTTSSSPGAGSRQSGGVERLSVRAVGRRVRILGDPSVATVSADGPHVLRRNGSVLEVSSDGELGASMDGFSLLKAPRNLDDIRSLGLGKELFLRVNPNIAVDVEVTAGSLHTERVPHLGKVRVTAGGAKLLDVEEISDALIQAGQGTIKGTIKTGRSRVRAESGSLSVHLADDSNVTVKGESQLGKISWSGGHSGAGDEVVMGNGSARLDVEVVMGHASIKVGTEPSDDDGSTADEDGQE